MNFKFQEEYVIMSDFIYDKIIIPMNNFADKHPNFIFRLQVTLCIISMILSIINLIMILSLK